MLTGVVLSGWRTKQTCIMDDGSKGLSMFYDERVRFSLFKFLNGSLVTALPDYMQWRGGMGFNERVLESISVFRHECVSYGFIRKVHIAMHIKN